MVKAIPKLHTHNLRTHYSSPSSTYTQPKLSTTNTQGHFFWWPHPHMLVLCVFVGGGEGLNSFSCVGMTVFLMSLYVNQRQPLSSVAILIVRCFYWQVWGVSFVLPGCKYWSAFAFPCMKLRTKRTWFFHHIILLQYSIIYCLFLWISISSRNCV